MPAYSFEIRWAGGAQNSWTYLPTDDSACKYARLLVKDFKTGNQSHHPAQLVVKNSADEPIHSIQF